MSGLMSPLMWQTTIFEDGDAWLDFLRMHDIHHYALAKATGTRFVLMDDLRENLRPHAIMHQEIAKSLGITGVSDLESFDLSDKSSWVSWHFLNAGDHQRMMVTAGL